MGKNGARPKKELVGVRIEDGRSSDIRWQQIGGELNATQRNDVVMWHVIDDAVAQGLGLGRFSRAWEVLQQDVAVGKDGDDDQLDDVIATFDGSLHPRL